MLHYIARRFIVLQECYVFYKLKARSNCKFRFLFCVKLDHTRTRTGTFSIKLSLPLCPRGAHSQFPLEAAFSRLANYSPE